MIYHVTIGNSCDDVKKKVITMNSKQKIVLWIGIVIIVSMCLFPPWMRIRDFGESRVVNRGTYQFLLTPPKPFVIDTKLRNHFTMDEGYLRSFLAESLSKKEGRYSVDYVCIDFAHLGIQCAIVALITVGLLCTLIKKKSITTKDKKVEIRK